MSIYRACMPVRAFVIWTRGIIRACMVIDSISAYAHKGYYNRNKRLKQAYTLSGKYYSGVGDARTAQLYNDSLVGVYRAEESEYTSQFISDARRQVADEEVDSQLQELSRQKQLVFMLFLLAAVLLCGFFVILPT